MTPSLKFGIHDIKNIATQYCFDFWWPYVLFCRDFSARAKIEMRTLHRGQWGTGSSTPLDSYFKTADLCTPRTSSSLEIFTAYISPKPGQLF